MRSTDTSFGMRLRGFAAELRRRRVFRVLVAYVVIGFGVAEGAGVFFPALGFPEWTVNLVALLVLLGLPVALGLAWAFDVVPDAGSARELGPEKTHREKVEDLFMSALGVPASARERFLADGAAGDAELLADARSMLEAHGKQGPLDELRERLVAPLARQVRTLSDMEGRRILHYEVLERLGGGGMGVVYKARDTRLDRLVALKFLSAHLLTDDEAKERFLVEAQAAAAVDHPNVCTIHAVGETDEGELYIAMAYYEGETLRERIAKGRLELEEALDIAAQTTRGLARAAETGVIHRDIKPANLILTSDGTVKVVDFGLAKVAGVGLTRTGARMGTVAYMSPEQTRGDEVDQRTDVWSVGVVLYEMLAGRRPFTGGSDQAVIHAILNVEPPSLSDVGTEIPRGVGAVLDRAMDRDPLRRHRNAAELLEDLERLLLDPSSRGEVDSVPSLPPEGERRRVTVLGCSIGGFETLLDQLPPEAVERELAGLHDHVEAVIDEYGGVLNEFSEDKMIALFGVPVTHEDDALRAVRAALALRDFSAEPHPSAEVELRSAIGSGRVAIRATRSGEKPYRVGGTVTRDVARLASSAGAGEVLVFPELVRVLSPFIETEERDEIQLSSDLPPLTPLSVIGESGSDSRFEAIAPGSLTRFVGRSDELHSLFRALEGSQSGVGRAVSVVGDAGVGKSRLLYEFRSTLADDGIRYVQGRCQAHGRLTPFLPFIECVKSILGLARSEPHQVHDRVVARTRALDPELEVYLPVLLHVLSIDSDTFPLPDYLVGEDLNAAVGEALASVFTLGSRGQPLVLLLEDWHWADGGSSEVLRHLSEMVSAYPLLLVVTARPEREGQRAPPQGDVRLELQPLDSTSASEVMRASLKGARIAPEVVAKIAAKTGGNPFFIEELCHTLLETRTVVLSGGEARLAGTIDGLTIPDTVQAVLKTRLDRLDPEAREVLRSASVIGRQFGLELLSRIVPSASRMTASLDKLRGAGLIQRTSLLPEPTYRFKHALTLDVTYESLLERQRRERHALVGEAIETIYASRLDEYSERLADHFAVAEDWARAVRYGFAAAERAAGVWRLDEAVATLERTRAWLDRRDGDEATRRRELVQLLFVQERHLETLGRRDQQQIVIDDLFEILGGDDSAELAQAHVRQGELHTLMGRAEKAQEALDSAVRIATEVGALDIRTMALRAVGHDLWRRGRYADAEAPLTEVVEWDRDGASTMVLLRDLVNLGRVLRELGDWARAKEIGDEVQTLAETSANPIDLVYAFNYQGHLFRTMERHDEALAAFENGNVVAAQARLPIRRTFNLLATAALIMEQGDIDLSLSKYEEALRVAQRANRPDNLAHALSLYGDALLAIGRSAEAVPRYDEAVEILQSVGKTKTLSEIMGKQAVAHEAIGDPKAAGTWRALKELRSSLNDHAGALEAAEHEARLEADAPDRARALHAEVLVLADRLDDAAAAARSHNALALLAWRQGDVAGARARYEQAAERLRGTGSREGLGAVLNGLGVALTSLGEHEAALSVLQEALDVNREDGLLAREADTLSAFGAACRASGDLARAYDWYHRCAEARRAAGDRAGEGWALHRLSELSRDAGAAERADTFAATALSIAREVDDHELAALCTSEPAEMHEG